MAFQQSKTDFLRVVDLVHNMSDVLDLDMPEYVIEEDKSKQTHILISKKNVRAAALVDEKQSAQQPEEVKNPYDPYDDELEQ